ncbi:MAG: ATP-binding cassette domain-containing protein [Planctomycetota bacterium]|jgi:ABC-type Fe3+/spermidine/putrescine transport system ATPase subunit
MSSLLQVQGLARSFAGNPVLRDLSLQLDAGERLSIQGPSGCGKSTLLRLLSGLDAADAGTIHVSGALATEGQRIVLQPWQRGIQMVFQDLGLWPTRSVLQHVMDVRQAAKLSDPRGVGERVLSELGLGDLLKRKPGNLSGGEARRLAFARVMALEPKLILLDEAFSSLDPKNRDQGFAVLEKVLADTGAAVIQVTHDPTEAKRLGGRSGRLLDGGLLCD